MSKYWRPQADAYLQEPTELAARIRGKNISRIVSDGLRDVLGSELEIALEENSNLDSATKTKVETWLKRLGRS